MNGSVGGYGQHNYVGLRGSRTRPCLGVTFHRWSLIAFPRFAGTFASLHWRDDGIGWILWDHVSLLKTVLVAVADLSYDEPEYRRAAEDDALYMSPYGSYCLQWLESDSVLV
jgi:hypothetical protein